MFGDFSVRTYRTSEILSTNLLIALAEAHSSTQSTPVYTLIRTGVVCECTYVLTCEIIIVTFSVAKWRVVNNKIRSWQGRTARLSDIVAQKKDELRECDHLAFVLFEDGDWLFEYRGCLPDWRNQAVITLT